MNRYAYVLNNPLNATDPTGLCGGDGFVDNCMASHDGGGGGGSTYLLDGVEVSAGLGQMALGMGAAVRCPNNVCNGFRSNGSYAQYAAFANGGGGYFAYTGQALPGDLYYTAKQAGTAAVQSSNPDSIKNNKEYSGNIYGDQNGLYSFTAPGSGDVTSSPFDPRAIPAETLYAGSYHDHAAFVLPSDENFSPEGCNGGLLCDIGLAMSPMNAGTPMFLGTPSGRVELFDPSQAGSLPFGCVLVGSPVAAGRGVQPVPGCPK